MYVAVFNKNLAEKIYCNKLVQISLKGIKLTTYVHAYVYMYHFAWADHRAK